MRTYEFVVYLRLRIVLSATVAQARTHIRGQLPTSTANPWSLIRAEEGQVVAHLRFVVSWW